MDWSELVLEVDSVIIEFGQAIVITHSTIGAYDPDLGTVVSTDTTVNTMGVMFDYGEKEINGTSIIKGDKKILIKPTGITSIEIGDTITVNTKDYSVITVTETNPAGTNLLYEVSVRGIA
jgi:hypothetical protein